MEVALSILALSLIVKQVGVALLVLIAALAIYIATRPAEFRIERSAQIGASPEVVFGLINDFHQWHLWSPWEKLDPQMTKTFGGASAGPGAVYSWSGNSKAGEGRMTLLESKLNQSVLIKLEFVRPFPACNEVTFTLVPADAGTRVTWSMTGKNGFVAKGFSLIMNIDKLVGKDFADGLANLGRAASPLAQENA